MSLSTATPEKIPGIEPLRRLTQSLAMLDAIICPEWESRYYSYNSKWGESSEMASMRNGSGDDWFLLFDRHGAALKGLAHEYALAGDASFAQRIQQIVPPVFEEFLKEPAFTMSRATFCLWHQYSDAKWNVVSPVDGVISPDRDGSDWMIGIFDGEPEYYRDWAVEYYEVEIPLAAVQAIYRHERLTQQLITSLNPDISLIDIQGDMAEIGYPGKRNA